MKPLPVAKLRPSGEKHRPSTESPWPFKVFTSKGWCFLFWSYILQSNRSKSKQNTSNSKPKQSKLAATSIMKSERCINAYKHATQESEKLHSLYQFLISQTHNSIRKWNDSVGNTLSEEWGLAWDFLCWEGLEGCFLRSSSSSGLEMDWTSELRLRK